MTATISTRNNTKTVRFAEQEVSAVFMIPRKNEQEIDTLFWSRADEILAREESKWEKLAEDAIKTLSISPTDNLNTLTLMAQKQFRYPHCSNTSMRRTRSLDSGIPSRRTPAGMA